MTETQEAKEEYKEVFDSALGEWINEQVDVYANKMRDDLNEAGQDILKGATYKTPEEKRRERAEIEGAKRNKI